ncbi:MAG TPA: penicillin acylase family protein [Opitutaceae bacterium]|nr:penicillin acylase family protein [Opitutaceae bacterium]
MRRILAAAVLLCAALAVAAAAAGFWLRGRMAAGLPRLDGVSPLPGLGAPVRVSRDALGVPKVDGSSRVDVARATGWLHAQDRFFQMDLLRRRGAGELAELFGGAALPLDRAARMHGFRRLAREVVARTSPARREILEAYAQGVNAGLAALGSKPWEYIVLRAEPRPWQPEDSALVTFAMTLDLQDGTGRYVRMLAAIRDELGPASLAFFAPLSVPGDAPLDGSSSRGAPLPPASEVDLRRGQPAGGAATARAAVPGGGAWSDRETPGSNNFAVSGAHGKGGCAIVANDMHLHLGVPNVWYRMSLSWPGHGETGVTLPGAPALVAGSTGRIAWGFTNSNGGTGDIVLVDPSVSPDLYHGPPGAGLLPFERRTETIGVRGSGPVTVAYSWTVWGPVVGEAPRGRLFAYRWTEDDPAATNFDIMDLEDAPDVRAAVAVAHRMGIPAQNVVVADSSGQIAWTIAGLLPRRVGYDGRLPITFIYGDRRWDGYLASADVPAIVSPEGGRLWTANNRTVGGRSLAALGDSGYDIAARASQIRDDLDALIRAARPIEPRDLLAIQLDDRAVMMGTWHGVLLGTLRPDVVARRPSRARLLQAVQKWEGRADVDSVSYRIVRAFRLAVAHRVFDPVFAPCVGRDADFSWSRLNYEEPLEAIIGQRPAHLLDPAFRTWDDLLAAAADDVSASFEKQGVDPRSATWGQRNTARIEHPFAQFLPRWAAYWLRMPAEPLPGDSHMPRVQEPSDGASERFAVSPGREADGIFHMPGGQSANPLSPYFSAGHEAWARGDPTPFLPGPAQHTLELVP